MLHEAFECVDCIPERRPLGYREALRNSVQSLGTYLNYLLLAVSLAAISAIGLYPRDPALACSSST